MENKVLDWYLEDYSEDNETFNDWMDRTISHIKWDLFQHQHEWVYMSGELGEGAFPKFKDNAVEYLYDVVNIELREVKSYIVDRLIASYRLSNIDLDNNTIEMLKEDLGEANYKDWEEEARKRIYAEYEEHLGVEKTKELFKDKWPEL